MISECLIKYHGFKEPMTDLTISLMKFMNGNPDKIEQLRELYHIFRVNYIYDLHYVEYNNGTKYYTTMCDIKSDSSEYNTRIKIKCDDIHMILRKHKLDKIKVLCQKLV